MNKLALPSSPKLQFRAFFVTMMLIALGLFGTQTASAAVLDTLHYNGHTYYLISENTYEGAASQSLSLGGYLATINDQGERSEEHTSELQSRPHLVCRLLLAHK